ncbi:N-acetyltransferase [Candidatus Lariskella endosymbiont of Epinotia ramella]|uniref:GNAT family N-acetyltransferase n=1 Tax=Candidatus Lariskella endosymbiont of Epinotia ramella TaxID=3066224 RepID=UPI0030D47347
MDNTQIRLLEQKDWEIWKQFRLETLQNEPENFESSYEDELHWPDSKFQDMLTNNDIFATFVNNSLASCAAFYQMHRSKTKHRGVIWSVYTKPEYRRMGIASILLNEIINKTRERVSQLHLNCLTYNTSAIELYKKHGFRIYGIEPKSIKVNNEFFDEYLMILDFLS